MVPDLDKAMVAEALVDVTGSAAALLALAIGEERKVDSRERHGF